MAENDDEVPPYALTDHHIKALETAIRAEGFEILVDTATGEVMLVREPVDPEDDRNAYDGSLMR